jgi:hypothetical protein
MYVTVSLKIELDASATVREMERHIQQAGGVILPRICGGVKASSILLAKEEKDHGKSSEDVFG